MWTIDMILSYIIVCLSLIFVIVAGWLYWTDKPAKGIAVVLLLFMVFLTFSVGFLCYVDGEYVWIFIPAIGFILGPCYGSYLAATGRVNLSCLKRNNGSEPPLDSSNR